MHPLLAKLVTESHLLPHQVLCVLASLRLRVKYMAILTCLLLGEQMLAQQQHFLTGHDGPVNCIEFMPGEPTLVSGGADGTVRFWDLNKLKQTVLLEHEGTIRSLHVAPDGKTVAAVVHLGQRYEKGQLQRFTQRAPEREVLLWEQTTDRELASWQSRKIPMDDFREVLAMSFAPDSQALAVAWTTRTSRATTKIATFDLDNLKQTVLPHEPIRAGDVEYSANGKYLSVCGRYDQNIKRGPILIWNAQELGEPKSIPLEYISRRLAFSPNGNTIAVAVQEWQRNNPYRSPGGIQFFDIATGAHLATFGGFNGLPSSIDYSPNGRYFAAARALPGNWGEVHGEVLQLIDVPAGRAKVLERDTHARDIRFSPDSTTLASTFTTPYPGVKLWKMDSFGSPQILRMGEPKSVVMHVRFSSDGQWLAAHSGIHTQDKYLLAVWNLAASPDESTQALEE